MVLGASLSALSASCVSWSERRPVKLSVCATVFYNVVCVVWTVFVYIAGEDYRIRIRFRVNHEIVTGLKFAQWVYKLKLRGVKGATPHCPRPLRNYVPISMQC